MEERRGYHHRVPPVQQLQVPLPVGSDFGVISTPEFSPQCVAVMRESGNLSSPRAVAWTGCLNDRGCSEPLVASSLVVRYDFVTLLSSWSVAGCGADAHLSRLQRPQSYTNRWVATPVFVAPKPAQAKCTRQFTVSRHRSGWRTLRSRRWSDTFA